MGDIIEICQGLLSNDNFNGVLVPQNDNNRNSNRINKRRADLHIKDIIIPLNSTGENNLFSLTSNQIRNANKKVTYSDGNNKLSITKNGHISGGENNLITSVNKMSLMIESLENKNKILEKEKNDMKKENEKLLEEIKQYKDNISKFKKNSIDNINDKDKDQNETINNINKDNQEQIKIIFLFKNKKKYEEDNNNSKEEIMAYKYEMFIEVKLRLLKIRNLGPTDIKSCYYNSKEINDWFTLEELNIIDNTYVICEYA